MKYDFKPFIQMCLLSILLGVGLLWVYIVFTQTIPEFAKNHVARIDRIQQQRLDRDYCFSLSNESLSNIPVKCLYLYK